MGVNEFLLVLSGILCAGFVLAAWKFNRERLYSAIIIFLILIVIVGGKTVEFFGHQTNTGNIFYASVFLATYFLIERYGRREGVRSIWIGVLCVACFAVLLNISLALVGAESTASLNAALYEALTLSSWVAIASLASYAISQNVNVYLYIYLKQYFNEKRLWLRANISNAVAQIIDSVIFFTIVFWGNVAPANIWDIIITGYVIKVVYMMFASLLLYYNTIEEEGVTMESIVTFRSF